MRKSDDAGGELRRDPREAGAADVEPATPLVSTQPVHALDALGTVACVYLALLTVGFAAFRFLATLPAGTPRTQDRAFFTAANAVSLTGFGQATAAVADYPVLGRFVLAMLALASAYLSLVAGGYFLGRALDRRIAWPTLLIASAAVLLAPLTVAFAFDAFNLMSATSGLGLSSGRVTAIAKPILVGLSAPGLVGAPLLLWLVLPSRCPADRRRYLAGSAIALVACYVLGAACLVACGTPATDASIQSLNLRGLGLPIARVDAEPMLPWATMVLVAVGGGPAGSGGGLGVLPIVVIALACADAWRRRGVDPLLAVAVAWVVAFGALVAGTTIALAVTAGALPGDRALLLAIAAVANVGVSHEPIGLTRESLFALSAAMLAGKLLPPTMLALMAMTAERRVAGEPARG